MRFEGKISSWNDERGFGFIEPSQGGQEVFVHIKAFGPRSGRPQINQPVSFEVESGPQGRKRARRVEPLRVASGRRVRRADSPAQWGTASLFVLPLFAVVYAVVQLLWRPPLWLAGLYLGASLLTYLAYAIDKSAATRRAGRTPEKTLHMMALAGGWPGALLAQQHLRHKSNKASFRAVFWMTVVLNVAAFVVLSSPGPQALWAR